jgi:hypothetical protein
MPGLGTEVLGEVRLRNSDRRPITIPGSTNISTIGKGQSPDAMQWQEGTFEFELKDQQGHRVALKGLTASLYGSKFAPGTELTLKSGESIMALVKFAISEELPTRPLRLKQEDWQLSASWVQTGRSRDVHRCESSNLYVHYDDFYRQQNPGVAIQVGAAPSHQSRMPGE